MITFYWDDVQLPGEEVNVAYCEQPQGRCSTLHDHDFYEVFLVESGVGVHHVGKRDHRKPLQSGQVVFIRPRDIHGFSGEASREPFSLINVAFSAHDWEELQRKYGRFGHPLFDESAKEPPEMTWHGDPHHQVVRLFHDLLVAPRTAFARDAFLLSLAQLVEGKGEEPLPSSLPAWLRHALYRFRDEPDFPHCGVARLVYLAGCSGGHLSRVMREHVHTTPSGWLREERLKRAKRLLSSGDMSVSEVAHLSGFENLSHFHRTFLKATGNTPRSFRKREQRIPV